MSDPAKYREMKRRAEKLGVIQGAPVPEDTPDTSKFTRRDTAYFDGINKVLNRNVKK
jgi:hypothetical protein